MLVRSFRDWMVRKLYVVRYIFSFVIILVFVIDEVIFWVLVCWEGIFLVVGIFNVGVVFRLVLEVIVLLFLDFFSVRLGCV